MAYASPGPTGPKLQTPSLDDLVPTSVLGVKLSVTAPAGKRLRVISATVYVRAIAAPQARVASVVTTAAGSVRIIENGLGLAGQAFSQVPTGVGVPLGPGETFALEVVTAAGAGGLADFFIGWEEWDA